MALSAMGGRRRIAFTEHIVFCRQRLALQLVITSIAFAARLAQVLPPMAQDSIPDDGEAAPVRRKRRPVRRFFQISLLVLVVVLVAAWLQRKDIARDLISDTLGGYGIEATYEIESIAPGSQVLTNLVIGDPDAPDLTVERVEVHITPRLGLPAVNTLILEEPRLWGTIVDGELSFGALDPLIFAEDSDEPFEFPDLQLTVRDGRALIEGDYGPLALRLGGAGHLRGGFAGELAAVAPELTLAGCHASNATLFGEVGIDAERPEFAGPLRFDALECADTGLSVAQGALSLDVRADRNLADFEGNAGLRAGRTSFAAAQIGALSGEGRFTWRGGDLTSEYDIEARDIVTDQARLAVLEADGSFRAREDFARMELETELAGRNLLPGASLDASLADMARASEGTLAAPLLTRLRQQLRAELSGSTLAANITARGEGEQLSVVIPEARLRGRSGASLVALSRGQVGLSDSGMPLFSGNIATGGPGLPQITGRMEQGTGGALELRLQMREYAAGDARLALPQLTVRQSRNGALSLDGRVLASGPLPGGFARNLQVPVAGTISPAGAIAMWSSCTDVRFDSLQVSNLALQRQSLTLCPPRGQPILRYDANGLALAAGAPSLDLAGTLGETPLQLQTGAVGLAWPGSLSARDIDVVLGPQDSAARFALTDLAAQLGDNISGTFSGTDVRLDALPLDIMQASGNWIFADGVLTLDGARFVLEDRDKNVQTQRFKPLLSRGARLVLADNVVTSNFALEHPASGASVARVDLVHDLNTAAGHADLMVDALTFRRGFQPTDLTQSLYGTVSLVDGTVFGRGRIDWDEEAVTSTGRFTSESLDLAAPFGPVKGARGTVVFTDLLGLTTAPAQRIYVEAINPGIEVYDGVVAISLVDGSRLTLDEARWPFLGGTLTMRPVTLAIGVEEVRRYVLEIEGLNAQRFIEHMELNNLGATGTFDGTIPVVFDAMGNGSLQGGVLLSRPPGGSVSYIGELTYEDLSPIANFAFDALRALEYDQMRIGMDGSLTGELVTSVQFDGVRQGEGASRNIVTRRIARLPFRFIVNVRAPFYTMVTNLRSLYDPSAVRDPRGLGLLVDDGTRFVPAGLPDPVNPDEPDIQPPESEATP
ncbi:intermembrane phospholipid transport protein YdbH family protein [Alteraurantiacibacter aquimixticola]|uniref:Uncharacterized protein n=1 Tax=Alteraurantiacibacter aquimixticola TaxID=2489173 RepID=A0A4T3F634_9SPHN|nr:YdbH domain-containing protein [Alteraurantiacibacter aquimixticola]TIX50316.1 hypothetical protein E5222_08530 [Alteraurantiacibacter aquimixticola]